MKTLILVRHAKSSWKDAYLLDIDRPLNKRGQRDAPMMGKRLAERELGLELTEAALDRLGEAGFDPVYGARPLKRAIQQQLENPLAQEILAGRFHPGQVIQVDVDGGQLLFRDGGARASAA